MAESSNLENPPNSNIRDVTIQSISGPRKQMDPLSFKRTHIRQVVSEAAQAIVADQHQGQQIVI